MTLGNIYGRSGGIPAYTVRKMVVEVISVLVQKDIIEEHHTWYEDLNPTCENEEKGHEYNREWLENNQRDEIVIQDV